MANRVAIWKQRRIPPDRILAAVVIIAAIWVIWRFRAYIDPKACAIALIQSPVALLKVIAYGVIPTILTAMGLHLAALAEPDSKKRAMWQIAFIFFAILGIGTIAYVEVKIDGDHTKEVTEVTRNFKTVLGQNTDMQSHIDVLIGRPTGSMTVIQKFPPVPLPTEEAKLRAMSNAQLKAYVMDWSQKLRNFDKSYRGEDDARFDSIPRFGENEAARNNYMRAYSEEGARRRDQQLSEYRTNFWGETVSIYKELVYRYRVAGKRVPDPMDLNPLTGTGVKVALNEGFLVAALGHPLLALAFYLETLAKDLPS